MKQTYVKEVVFLLEKNGNHYVGTYSLAKLVHDTLKTEFISGHSFLTCPAGKELAWKTLPYTAVVVMGECEAVYTAEIKDKWVVHQTAGSIMIIPAGEVFRLELSAEATLQYVFLSFTVLDNIDIFSFLEYPWIVQGTSAAKIIPVVNELIACGNHQKEYGNDLLGEIKLKQVSLELINGMFRNGKVRPDLDKHLADIQRVESVVNYINAHMADRINRKTLAELLNLSETRFHYVFKEMMGVPPMKYLLLQRFQKAQKLLLTTSISIEEIAEMVGFENHANFTRLFKKYYHMSPMKYRKMKAMNLILGRTI